MKNLLCGHGAHGTNGLGERMRAPAVRAVLRISVRFSAAFAATVLSGIRGHGFRGILVVDHRVGGNPWPFHEQGIKREETFVMEGMALHTPL
jgi:hypothetical protein